MGAVVGQHGVHPVGHGGDQALKEVTGHTLGNPLVQLHKGELGRAVDGNQQVELALLSAHLGDIDMEEADRVALELGPPRLVAVGVGSREMPWR